MTEEAELASLTAFGKRGGIIVDEMSVQDDLQVNYIHIYMFQLEGDILPLIFTIQFNHFNKDGTQSHDSVFGMDVQRPTVS
ncbi:MAG: hypothetical protein ABW185_02615 [Sedimenticola sp.]